MNKKLTLLIVLSALVYGANIWGTSIYILDEAKNAGCAMEMLQRADWIVPTFNNELRTDKPPLHYFFMMSSYKVFGVTSFSARLFSSLMGVFTVLVVFFYTRKIVNESAAFLAAVVLLSSIQLAIQFHLAVPDPYLIFFLTTAWLSFYYACQSGKSFYLYVFYTATALATLAKGPVALVLTMLIVVLYLIVNRKFTIKEILRLKFLHGVVIIALIVLPWYIAVGVLTDGVWLEQFFFKHNLARFTSSMEGHGGFPFASFVIVLVGLVPFSFFFPQCLALFTKEKQKDPFIVFCFICMTVVVVFFAFSKTILPTYPEPALPFFAIVMGCFISKVIQKNETLTTSFMISGSVFLVVSVFIPIAVRLALLQDISLNDVTFLSGYFIVFPVGALLALVFLIKRNLLRAVYTYAIINYVFLLLFFFLIFPEIDKKNPVHQSLSIVKGADKNVAVYRDFNPAYVIGLQSTIPKINSLAELTSQPTEYLISQKRYLPALDSLGYKIVYEGKDLFEKPVTVVVFKKIQKP